MRAIEEPSQALSADPLRCEFDEFGNCIQTKICQEGYRKTEECVDRLHRRPVEAPRYESGGEAQALVRPARSRGLPLPKTCAARVVA